MTQIIVLGDLNLDVLAKLPEVLPPSGEVRTLVQTSPGGSAANFARTAAHEGATVTFIGCVGNDLIGDLLIQSLEELEIDVRIKRVDLPTGTIISLSQDKNRTMLCSRGANDGLDPAWIKEELFQSANHLHLSGYSFLSHSQQEAARKAITISQTIGMTISVDPPPANLLRAFGVKTFAAEITKVDWLFPNLDEGKLLSGKEDPEEIVTMLAKMFSAGVLTLGEEGSLAWSKNARDRCEVTRIKELDAIGAGDVFAAVFVVSYLEGHTLHTANRWANEATLRVLKERAVST